MNIDPIQSGDRVLCAVSGGADSMYLLNRMLELAGKRKITVLCAHFNHKQRGAESDRDEQFVLDFCESKGIPCFTGNLEGEAHSENQLREARYAFLRKTAEAQNCRWILTAHTADDQLETQLLNLARGTGLKGLSGIPTMRGNILRPMLHTTRGEIETWLAEHQIPYVEDSSNRSDRYARNRIRQEAIPALQSVNPSAAIHASYLADRLREDDECLRDLAERFLEGQNLSEGISAKELEALPRPIRARVFQMLCDGKLASSHIEALHDFCYGTEAGSLDLPGIRVIREQGKILFGAEYPERLPETQLQPGMCFELPAAGLRVTVSEPHVTDEIHNTLTVYHFKSESIRGKLIFTSRRPGDQIRLLGRCCTKKINDLMLERGIPLSTRDLVPVLRDEMGPVALCGFGMAERCEAKPGDLTLCVQIEKLEKEK